MKRKYIILFISLFISLFIFNIINISFSHQFNTDNIQTNQEAKPDIDYIFNENLLYKNDNKYNAFKYYNIKNRTEIKGNYPATFSFDDDNIGQFPEEWELITENGGKAIVTNYYGHEKVLCLADLNNSGSIKVRKEINLGVANKIEFWCCMNDTNGKLYIFLGPNSYNCIYLVLNDLGYITYYDTSFHNIITYQKNIWYHIEIEFNFYTDIFNIWINSKKYGNDLGVKGNPNLMDYIYLSTIDLPINKAFIDAIDLGNDNGYYRHRNLIPKNEYIESESNGNYESTCSFTNDTIGIIPENWIDNSGPGCNATISEEINKHKYILQFNDNSISNIVNVSYSIEQQTFQMIEFWLGISTITSYFYIEFQENNKKNVVLRINNNELQFLSGIYLKWITIKKDFFIPNVLFHIKLELNNLENKFHCYINGILESFNSSYNLPTSISLNNIEFSTVITGYNYKVYIDAIGLLSDSNYIIGSNYYSQKDDIINKWEFDKYEFNYIENEFENDNYLWRQYEYQIENWISVDFINANNSNIIYYSKTHTGLEVGQYKQGLCFNESINNSTVNFTFNFMYDMWNDYGSLISWKFYSYTFDTELIPIVFAINTSFDIANPLQNRDWLKPIMFFYPHNFSWGFTGIFVETDKEMSLDFYLNYDDNIAILSNHTNSKIIEIEVDTFWENLYGFSKLNITYHNLNSGTIEGNRGYFRSIGIYGNGISYKKNYMNKREYSLIKYKLKIDNWKDWDTEIYNILNITIESECTFYISSNFYTFLSTGITIKNRNYINKSRIYNLYKDYKYSFSTPYLIIMLYNNFTLVDYLSIFGVKITREGNETITDYYADYYWNKWYDTDFDFNSYYYYVKDNNLYYYIHNLDFNSYFNIQFKVKEDMTNYTLNFASYISNNYTGQSIFKYGYSWGGIIGSKTYDIFEDIYPKLISISLPNYTLWFIEININNYHNNSYDISKGYVSSLKLIIDILSFEIIKIIKYEIIIDGLLFILTRLLFIFLPTLIFYNKLGEKSVVPIFLLMSIISVISGLIPMWILFIIFFGCGLFLINERGEV